MTLKVHKLMRITALAALLMLVATGGASAQEVVSGGIYIAGNVYGGANQAKTDGNTKVTIYQGTCNQLYGGSNGAYDAKESSNTVAADITGSTEVDMYGGTVHTVYGGSNVKGNILGGIVVNIDSTAGASDSHLQVDFVYGAGNKTGYEPTSAVATPQVNVLRGTVNRAVFGGGMGDPTRSNEVVKANPQVKIGREVESTDRVRIGNAAGTLAVQSTPDYVVPNTEVKGEGYVFGGGNLMETNGDTKVMVIGNNTMILNSVYGGGNQAPVSGSTDVHIGEENE